MWFQPVPLKMAKKTPETDFGVKKCHGKKKLGSAGWTHIFSKNRVEPAQLEIFAKLWVQPGELCFDTKNSSWAEWTWFLGRRSSGTSSPRVLEKWSGGTHSTRWQETSGLNRQKKHIQVEQSCLDWWRKSTVQETGHKKHFYIQNFCGFFERFYVFSRWGWIFLERTQILSGIQFTTHFIDFCCGNETIRR